MTQNQVPSDWERIKNGIFAGESGGDYNALFGFSNRPGKRWSGVKLTSMTVDQAIQFSDPQGEYGSWVKEELRRSGQTPRIATPMGAYQIVGTTLRSAKHDLGLTGSEMMTEELQDRLGIHIYNKQGTGAWEGYKGPSDQKVYYEGGPEGTRWDDGTYAGISAAAPPDVYAQQSGQKPFDSWFGEVGAALQSSSWTAHMMRWAGEGTADPNYTPGKMFSPESLRQYPEQYHDMLLSADSLDNAKSRLKWVEEDMVRRARLQQGGASAIAAEVVSGIVDPVPLVAGVLTGGIGVVARGGLAARAAAGAASGAAFNAGMDAVAQGVFDDPYADPVMAGAIGAVLGSLGGALARSRATSFEADELLASSGRIARGDLKSTTAPASAVPDVSGAPGNLNSARNTSIMRPLIPDEAAYVSEMSDDAVPRGFGGKADFGVSGQMISSDVPLVRLAGMHFFEAAAGTKGNHVTPDSVNTVQKAMHRQAFGNFMTEYHPARMEFLKEQDIFRLNPFERAKAAREFSRQVARYVEDEDFAKQAGPSVRKAGEAFRKGMADWHKQINESGLAELPPNPHYVPKVANHERIADIDARFSEEAVEELISRAILKHTPTLRGDIVKRMSKGYWRILRRAAYGMEDGVDQAVQLGDKEAFKRAFADALDDANKLDDDQLDAAFDALGSAMEGTSRAEGGSSRGVGYLKKRTLLDYNEPGNVALKGGKGTEQLRVRDFFEDDAELLFGRYSRNMSGRVAFSKMQMVNPDKGEVIVNGLRSEADLVKFKDMIREAYRQHYGGELSKFQKDLDNQIQNIDFGWKRINGIPVWDNQNEFNQWARRLKTMQFTRLMSNMGLNQVQEAWKITSLLGMRATMSQLPSIRQMVREARTGRVSGDQLLEELTDLTGLGLESLHTRFNLRMDDDRIGEGTAGAFGKRVDQALDAGSQLTSTISLMRAINDFQQRWAVKAITQRLVDMGQAVRTEAGDFDLSKLGTNERNRLASIGLGDDDAKLLFRNLLSHAQFDGKRITGVNVQKWDPEAVSKFRNFVNRYADRLVQQNDYGALPKWMSHPVASMFVQFRSFVFGAWSKSTLWSVNHGGMTDPRMMVLLLGELAAGTATFMIRQSTLLGSEEGRAKFEEEVMDPASLLKNGWARTATASVVPMLIDSMLLTGQLAGFKRVGTDNYGFDVTPQFGQARSSGSPTDAFLGSPVTDQARSMMVGLRGVKQALLDDEDMSQSEINSLVRALPLPTNFVPFSAALGALISDRAEK